MIIFLLGLSKLDAKCTLKLWYHIIPQAKISLNILCLPRLHHQLFDQFHISRSFGCETNPIGHPVTCVVANIKPTCCLYLSPHGDPWLYIGPTMDNYLCHSVYINKFFKNKWLIQWISTKLYNDMYDTCRFKNKCCKLCSTIVTNQILTYPLKNQVNYKLN